MNNIIFERYKKQVNVDNTMLYFEFYGIPKEDNIDVTRINNIIDSIFNTKNFDTNIKQIIYYIRIILSQYDEKSLLVEVKNLDTDYYVKVNLKDKKVIEYHELRTLGLNSSENVQMKIKFNENDGFSVHIPNHFNSINLLYLNDCYIQNAISSSYILISDINEMKMLDNMYFNKEEKMLIDIYQMFFDENPDFSKKETVARIQSMMFILAKYDILLPNQDGFYMDNMQEYPISESIHTIIERLVPFGEIDRYRGDQVRFMPKVNNDIFKIGKLINEFCSNYEEGDKVLNSISSILYVIDNLPPYAKISDILNSSSVKCHKEIVRNIIGLLAVIDETINGVEENDILERYENLYTACSMYFEVELPNYENMPRFDVEKDYYKIAQGGFIEKYCLSEEEQKRLKLIRKQKI